MKIQEIFALSENGTLTFEQFEKFASEKSAKFADLSEGKYEDVNKRTNEIENQKAQIKSLEDTLKKRDTDLNNLKTQLEAAGADTSKLTSLQGEFDKLKAQYAEDAEKHKAEIGKLNYEYACKEAANPLKFTSNAAKRDFINKFIAAGLKMDNGKIMGADDFIKQYSTDNEDAFVKDEPEPKPQETPKPKFTDPTGNNPLPKSNKVFNFQFSGVRAHKND